MAKKILVVDDEQDILTTVKMVLEKQGYKVTTVNGGKKALELLDKEKFDLVLLDILMPEMSGDEVAKKIRKNSKLKNQKIAFLTVVTLREQGKAEMKKLNPADYIQKPFLMDEFRKRIKKIIGSP